MPLRWITNIDKARARELRNEKESQTGKVHLIGRPKGTDECSVTELEHINYVGIYMKTSDERLEPDPNCLECKGKGIVTLLTSSVPCKCLKNPSGNDNTYDYNEGYWE